MIRALVDASAYDAKNVVIFDGTNWQCEIYDFCYDLGASDPWSLEIINQIPVDGLQNGSHASTPALQAKWNALHGALTCSMAAKGTTPAGWPAAPPAAIPS